MTANLTYAVNDILVELDSAICRSETKHAEYKETYMANVNKEEINKHRKGMLRKAITAYSIFYKKSPVFSDQQVLLDMWVGSILRYDSCTEHLRSLRTTLQNSSPKYITIDQHLAGVIFNDN